VKFYATVASNSEGSPSFILLATCILERSDASLGRIIHRHCCRTRSRTLHTQSLSPRCGIGPRHQLYAALSSLHLKAERETTKRLWFPMQQQQSTKQDISIKIPCPKLNPVRNHLVTQGPVSSTYSCLGAMRELPLLAPYNRINEVDGASLL
jgi:hypothetical protein